MAGSSNKIHIAAFTFNYLFRGVVTTGSKRLSDVVNDRITAYMELLNARVYNLTRPETAIFTASELYLKKQRIEVIAIIKEEIHQPIQRIYSFVSKERRPATLFLRNFELQGQIHLHGKHEMMGPLTREGELFIPVTDATLVSTINPRVKINAQTILLLESALDGFYVAEEETRMQAIR